MTVNITQNALGSQPDSDITRKASTVQSATPKAKETSSSDKQQQALTKLSSGISLPQSTPKAQLSDAAPEQGLPKADSSEVSEKAVNRNIASESTISDITVMQEEVTKLDELQGYLEDVSQNLWGIEGQVASSQNLETSRMRGESPKVVMEKEHAAVNREEMQKTVDTHLSAIDDTGKELLGYISEFRDKFLSDLDLSSETLGKTENAEGSFSLSSLRSEVDIATPTASEIVTKAQEEVASLQVTAETYRSNTINDIGNTLNSAISGLEAPVQQNSVENSVKEVTNILERNPSELSKASQIDVSQVASLLL